MGFLMCCPLCLEFNLGHCCQFPLWQLARDPYLQVLHDGCLFSYGKRLEAPGFSEHVRLVSVGLGGGLVSEGPGAVGPPGAVPGGGVAGSSLRGTRGAPRVG